MVIYRINKNVYFTETKVKYIQNSVPRCIKQASSVEISFNYAPEMDMASQKQGHFFILKQKMRPF